MFSDAYDWDRQNCLSFHRKLTDEHIHPSNQEKIRNHLAEEMLNAEMLNLILHYQKALEDKGEVLNGLIKLL